MDKMMEKLNKLSLPAVILIASVIVGGFYYASQVSKQRSIEKQQQIKIEQEKQEKLTEQQAEEESKQALNTCIANAEESYSNQWHKECKRLGKLTNKCIDINELTYDEYLKKYGLTTEEYAEQRNLIPSDSDNPASLRFSATWDYIKRSSNECSCALPISLADSVNEDLQKNKDMCFKKYPQ